VRADAATKPGLSLEVKGGKGNKVAGGVWADGTKGAVP
jgi:hypothetical protein